jgi:hypothetical protein
VINENGGANLAELAVALIRRLGNLTSAGTSEVLLCGRTYTEPASEAQRSVKSTSASDTNSAGSGAKAVRITYLTSSYVLKTEDVLLNGVTGVNTVASDIRFIEKFEVIKGTFAVGAVTLQTTTAGGGTEICGVGAGATDAFLCHHYVPAGRVAYLLDWSAVTSLDTVFKLFGQARVNDVDLIDQVVDLYSLLGPGVATQGRAEFFPRSLSGVPLAEKTYVRVKVVPGATGAINRAVLQLLEYAA